MANVYSIFMECIFIPSAIINQDMHRYICQLWFICNGMYIYCIYIYVYGRYTNSSIMDVYGRYIFPWRTVSHSQMVYIYIYVYIHITTSKIYMVYIYIYGLKKGYIPNEIAI